MRSFVAAVPFSVVAAVIAVIAALALAPRVALWLRARRWLALLLLLGIGLVLAATIVPDADAFAGIPSDGTCDLSRLGIAPIGELTTVTTTSLNVLLFLPLGVAVAWLPKARRSVLVLAFALSLTFLVEGIQLLVTELGRGCQSADMIDNLMGLMIGLGIGLMIRWLLGDARLRLGA
jgi:VanZ family protein